MNTCSSLLLLLLVFSALCVLEASIVEKHSRHVIDLTYPGCGRRPIHNNRKGGFTFSFTERIIRFGIQPIIVGGVTAKPHSWPWMVAILKTREDGDTNITCGGSLISRKYVLCAAHCFVIPNETLDITKYHAMLGAYTLEDGIEYPIQNILTHPDFNLTNYLNDISVIQLAKDVSMNDNILPVCLPSAGLLPKINSENKKVIATGWGLTSVNGTVSNVLREVTLSLISRKECTSYIPLYDTEDKNAPYYQFCAFVKKGGKDTCPGDSGGPLVTKMTDHSWVQLGITSFGYNECGTPDNPGVYTNLTTFSKWIYDNTDLG